MVGSNWTTLYGQQQVPKSAQPDWSSIHSPARALGPRARAVRVKAPTKRSGRSLRIVTFLSPDRGMGLHKKGCTSGPPSRLGFRQLAGCRVAKMNDADRAKGERGPRALATSSC